MQALWSVTSSNGKIFQRIQCKRFKDERVIVFSRSKKDTCRKRVDTICTIIQSRNMKDIKMKSKTSMKNNAVLNTIKQLCSVLFPLITVPYVTRVLGTEYYGRINWVNSVVSYFALFAGFGIATYAAREGARKRENRVAFEEYANEVFTINIITTIISYLILFLVTITWPKLKENSALVLAHSMIMVFSTLGTDWINIVYEDYRYITIRYVFTHIISVVLMFVFVKSPSNYITYAVISVFSSVGGNLFNIFYVRKYVHLKIVIPRGWKTHIIPMLILLGNSLAVLTYVNTDITLLGIYKTDVDVGIYSVATKMYTIIKQLINAIVVVSLPRLSLLIGEKREEEYRNYLSGIINIVLVVLIPAMVGLFMISKELIQIISGSSYVDGNVALRILCVSLGFAVCACFFQNCVMLPQKKEKLFFIATLLSCAVNIILNLFFIPYMSYNGAAITTLIAEALVCIICFCSSKETVNGIVNKRSLGTVSIGSILIIIVCLLVRTYVIDPALRVILSAGISIILYFTLLLLTRNPSIKKMFSILSK